MNSPTRRKPHDPGMSLFAGAVDADGVPSLCRAVALTARDDLSKVTVFVPMATSQRLLAGIAATKRIAVVASYPPDHTTTQLKGIATSVRLAAGDEEPFVRARFQRFADVLHAIGVPYRVTDRISRWPAFAIDIDVDEVYEQTPGPKAGSPIR